MIKMLIIWLATALVLIAETTTEQSPEDQPRVFCGRALAEARMLYCLGTEDKDSTELEKRSTSNPEDEKVWWVPRHLAYLVTSREKRNGLVDECCIKPCFISELLSYC